MLNASVEPMPVIVTTQMMIPMAAQAIPTCMVPLPPSMKAWIVFLNVILEVLSFAIQLARMTAPIPENPANNAVLPAKSVPMTTRIGMRRTPLSFKIFTTSGIFSFAIPFNPCFFASKSMAKIKAI